MTWRCHNKPPLVNSGFDQPHVTGSLGVSLISICIHLLSIPMCSRLEIGKLINKTVIDPFRCSKTFIYIMAIFLKLKILLTIILGMVVGVA